MSSNGKLAYLSKYGAAPTSTGSGGGGGSISDDDRVRERGGKKKKKEKKSKKDKKKSKRTHKDASKSAVASATRIRDMDDMDFLPTDHHGGDAPLPGEEEGPAIVDAAEVFAAAGEVGVGGGEQKSVTRDGGFVDVSRQTRRSSSPSPDQRRRRRQRHDSSSSEGEGDGEGSRARNNGRAERSSDNMRRRRHDSFSSREENPRSDGHRRGRKRHDSSGESDSDGGGKRSNGQRRERRDSYDDEDGDRGGNLRRRRRHNSEDDIDARRGKERRRRHDPPSDDESVDRTKLRGKRRRRHGSESNSDRDGRGSDDDAPSSSRPAKMSSGHAAGLQTSTDFARAESVLQKRKRADAKRNAATMERGETVHRNASGQKIDADAERERDEMDQAKKAAREERMSRELNMGARQREKEEAAKRALKNAANMTLTRGVGDQELEERKKGVIRDGDPMAMLAFKKQAEERAQHNGGGEPAKPVYKGPPPKPNRFGIRPGYRWDGNDRGNGFEDKVLSSLYSKNHKKEAAYRWSSADM